MLRVIVHRCAENVFQADTGTTGGVATPARK